MSLLAEHKHLTSLWLDDTNIRDLKPLYGKNLITVGLTNTPLELIEILKLIKTLPDLEESDSLMHAGIDSDFNNSLKALLKTVSSLKFSLKGLEKAFMKLVLHGLLEDFERYSKEEKKMAAKIIKKIDKLLPVGLGLMELGDYEDVAEKVFQKLEEIS